MNIKLLRPKEVAERLGVSRRTVYYLIEKGELPSVTTSERTIRIDESDLLEYIENNKREDYAFLT